MILHALLATFVSSSYIISSPSTPRMPQARSVRYKQGVEFLRSANSSDRTYSAYIPKEVPTTFSKIGPVLKEDLGPILLKSHQSSTTKQRYAIGCQLQQAATNAIERNRFRLSVSDEELVETIKHHTSTDFLRASNILALLKLEQAENNDTITKMNIKDVVAHAMHLYSINSNDTCTRKRNVTSADNKKELIEDLIKARRTSII